VGLDSGTIAFPQAYTGAAVRRGRATDAPKEDKVARKLLEPYHFMTTYKETR
jgi:hypothetical protein